MFLSFLKKYKTKYKSLSSLYFFQVCIFFQASPNLEIQKNTKNTKNTNFVMCYYSIYYKQNTNRFTNLYFFCI